MPLDQPRDARRLRLGLLLSGLLLLAGLVGVGVKDGAPEWRALRNQYAELGLGRVGDVDETTSLRNCLDQVDRCTTCHLGSDRVVSKKDTTPAVFAAHPPATRHHIELGFGCTVCHGGTGRSLEKLSAHAAPGTGASDPLLTAPGIRASCRRCHVPGAQPGMETLVRGADLYLGLGCAVCHPLTTGGRGGWDYGPDLRAIGRKDVAYLEKSLLEPTANFPESTMPSFAITFKEEPEAFDEMMVFLQSLVLEPAAARCQQRGQTTLVNQPCATCHDGSTAGGRFEHRCVFIVDRAETLGCQTCHPQGAPTVGAHDGWCPAISAQRSACAACHDPTSGPGERS